MVCPSSWGMDLYFYGIRVRIPGEEKKRPSPKGTAFLDSQVVILRGILLLSAWQELAEEQLQHEFYLTFHLVELTGLNAFLHVP